jgi:glycerophosphoryl diester phosphodiesterase
MTPPWTARPRRKARSRAACRWRRCRIRLKGTAGETIPTLAEVAAIFAPTPIALRMELKDRRRWRPLPRPAGEGGRRAGRGRAAGRTTVTSFRLDLAAEAAADARFGGRAIWLVSRPCWREAGSRGVMAAAQAAGVNRAIAPHSLDCDGRGGCCRGRRAFHRRLSVNGEETVRRILGLGIDVFTTDDPVGALRLR